MGTWMRLQWQLLLVQRDRFVQMTGLQQAVTMSEEGLGLVTALQVERLGTFVCTERFVISILVRQRHAEQHPGPRVLRVGSDRLARGTFSGGTVLPIHFAGGDMR